MRDYIQRNIVRAYTTDAEGMATTVDIVDYLRRSLINEQPLAPTIIGSIQDRVYTVGSGPYMINLSSKFSGAISYMAAPQPIGVSLSDAILTIQPIEPLAQTEITLRGVSMSGESASISFRLTVEAKAVEPPKTELQIPGVITAPSIAAGPYELNAQIVGQAGIYSNDPTQIARRWMIRDASSQEWSQVTDATGLSISATALMTGHDRILMQEQPSNTIGAADWVDSNIEVLNVQDTITPEPNPEAPIILTSGYMNGPPLVQQQIEIAEPEVAGVPVPELAYQWYRGTPRDGGVPIGGATSSGYTPSVADYGADLWLRVMASNAGGSAQVDVPAGRVGAVFADDWSGFAVGDTLSQLLASYGRNNFVGAGVVADAAAPAGQALRIRADNNQTCFVYGSAASAFGAAQAADTTRTQALYLFRHIGANSGRYHLRFASAALSNFAPGVMVHTDNLRLQIDTDSINDTGGTTLATLTAGTLYWLRLEQEGVNIRAKLWADGAGEPAEFLSRVCTTAVTPPAPAFGTRYAAAVPADQYDLLYWSAGYNADAPWPAGHEPPALVASAPMAFAAAAAQSSFAQGDGMITWNFEDI